MALFSGATSKLAMHLDKVGALFTMDAEEDDSGEVGRSCFNDLGCELKAAISCLCLKIWSKFTINSGLEDDMMALGRFASRMGDFNEFKLVRDFGHF